jgi:predicted PurR-regulated permease PerM
MADEGRSGLWPLKAAVAFIAVVFFVMALRALQAIFIPFCIALFLYFLLNGVVRQLRRWRVPKSLALIGVLAGIFVCLYLSGLLLFTGAASFVEQFPAYSAKITGMVKGVLAHLKLPIVDVQQYLAHIDWDQVLNPARITAFVSTSIGNFAGFVGNLLLVLLLLMFMLGEKVPMAERIARSLPAERAEEMLGIIGSINARVQHYLFIKTLMSVATGGLAALILLAGRVDFVIFTALLVFFLNYIPTFGSLLSTIFPALIAFVKFGFSPRFVLVTVALMAMQFLMGNVVEPQVMGRSLDLSPIVILLSLIFWGWLWGVVGMFLAVPVTSAIQIVFAGVPSLKPLAAAMGSE